MSILKETVAILSESKSLILDVKILGGSILLLFIQKILSIRRDNFSPPQEGGLFDLMQSIRFEGLPLDILVVFGPLILCIVAIYGILKKYVTWLPVDRIIFILTALVVIYIAGTNLVDRFKYSDIPGIISLSLFIIILRYLRSQYNMNINSITAFLGCCLYIIISLVQTMHLIYPHILGIYINTLPDTHQLIVFLAFFIFPIFLIVATMIHRLSVVLEPYKE